MKAKRENSLLAVQAQNDMWKALWDVAIDEAYTARDAKRRTDEIQGMPERAVVEVYFNYHPEMRTWAEGHIAAGTCEAAVIDLHERLELVRKERKENRVRNDAVKAAIEESMRVPSFEDIVETDDWMAPFKAGPAIWPTQSGSNRTADQPKDQVPVSRVASDEDIKEAVRAVYSSASSPPNLVELWPLVRDKLAALGTAATKTRVQTIGEADEFARLRNKPGQRRAKR